MDLASTTHPGNPERHLVVVHGYTGSQDDFAHVIAPLAAVATVTTVDLPGHGLSPRLARYDFAVMAAALESFVVDNELTTSDVLGHSMGGRIVAQLGVSRPELFRSIVLMSTWGDMPDRGDSGAALRNAFARPEKEIVPALDAIDHDTGERSLIEKRWGPAWVARHFEHNERTVDTRARIDLGRLVFVTDRGTLRDLASVPLPTTVLVGSEDEAMLGSCRRLAEIIPSATLTVIDGAFHSPQLTHTAEWQGAVLRHLAAS